MFEVRKNTNISANILKLFYRLELFAVLIVGFYKISTQLKETFEMHDLHFALTYSPTICVDE